MIGIFGAGGFGRELVRPVTLWAAEHDDGTVMFIDDDPALAGRRVCGLEVRSLADVPPGSGFVAAVGSGKAREAIASRCVEAGLRPVSVRAPTVVIGEEVELGEGALMCDFTMVTASARIGRQFQANIYSYVAHDCVIGDHVTFAPKVACNGNVQIEDYAYIGTGAVLKQGTADKPLVIGAGAVVGMGAVVTKNVAPGEVVVGNPAAPLRR